MGPKMKIAREYIIANPGCCKADAARICFPGSSWKRYGYLPVNRLIERNIVRATRVSGVYKLYDAGSE